jgi:hypothetical protein
MYGRYRLDIGPEHELVAKHLRRIRALAESDSIYAAGNDLDPAVFADRRCDSDTQRADD